MKTKEFTTRSKRKLYAIVIILIISSVLFRLLNDYQFEQTSLLFIGLPALVTVLVIKFSKRPKGLYGMMAYVITLFLLMSAILFGEGIPCILLASPLFYGVGALIIKLYKMSVDKENRIYSYGLIPVVLLLISDPQNFKSEEIHRVETVVEVAGLKSLEAFEKQPNFMENYPAYFRRVGFPKPISILGEGLEVGDYRHVGFKSDTRGIGTLSLRVIDVEEDKVVFDVPMDDTHMHHWLTWAKVTVNLRKVGENTEVTWVSEFSCDLGPSWYFLPIEKYTIDIMNAHLIRSYFN